MFSIFRKKEEIEWKPSTSHVYINFQFKSKPKIEQVEKRYSIRIDYEKKEEITNDLQKALSEAFKKGEKIVIDLGKYDSTKWNSNYNIITIDMNEVSSFLVGHTTN